MLSNRGAATGAGSRSLRSLRRYVERTEEREKLQDKFEVGLMVFRVILICSMLGIALYYVISDIIKYFQRDTITAVSVDLLSNVTFPAVTICNYNRWKRSLLSIEDQSNLQQQMQAEQEMNTAPFDYYAEYDMFTTEMYANDSSASSGTSSTTASITTTTAHSSTNASSASGFNLYNFTRYGGWKLTDGTAINSSVSVNGTLLSCTFRGVDCDTNFFTRITTSYGNCYTFNKAINWANVSTNVKRRLSSPLVQTVPHENTGLSLDINIEAWDYFENVDVNGNYQLGLKVIVHSPDRLPNPSSEGIPVSPGFHASIPVTWSENVYMEPPYGSCNASASLQYFSTYTQEGCMWECIKKRVLSSCSCVVYYQANDTDLACDLTKSKNCAYKLISDIENNPDSYCTCPVGCTEESYESTAYYGTSPSKSMAPGLAAQYGMATTFYSENVVSMDIFFREMSKTTVTQVKALTLDQVFANAGGQLGLFAGVSFITFMELVEFAFDRWATWKAERRLQKNVVHVMETK